MTKDEAMLADSTSADGTWLDDLLDEKNQKAVAVMARYGVNDPYDPKLSNADRADLHRELKALWPELEPEPGPDTGLYRDPVILWALGMAGKKWRTRAAKKLEGEFRADGGYQMSWQTIRARYYIILKKLSSVPGK